MFTTTLKDNMSLDQYIFDTRYLLGYLIAAFVITVIVMIIHNRITFRREKAVRNESERLNAQLALIMTSNKTQVWTYDIQQNIFRLLSQEDLKETVYIPYDFSKLFDREDFDTLRKAIKDIKEGNLLSDSLVVKGAAPKDEKADKQKTIKRQNYQRAKKLGIELPDELKILDSQLQTK